MEDVVITLGGGTRPDVCHRVAELLHVVEVTWEKIIAITILYGTEIKLTYPAIFHDKLQF